MCFIWGSGGGGQFAFGDQAERGSLQRRFSVTQFFAFGQTVAAQWIADFLCIFCVVCGAGAGPLILCGCCTWSRFPVLDLEGGGVAENRWGSSRTGVWIYPHSLLTLRQTSLSCGGWEVHRGCRKSGGGSFGKPPPKYQKRKTKTLSLVSGDRFVICWL